MKIKPAPGEIGELSAWLFGDGPLARIAKEHDAWPLELFGQHRKRHGISAARKALANYLQAHVGYRDVRCESCTDGDVLTSDGHRVRCKMCGGIARLRKFAIFDDDVNLPPNWRPLPTTMCAALLGLRSHAMFVRRRKKAVPPTESQT